MQFTKIANFGQSGLTSVGFTLYDKDGSLFQSRTETGINELGTSGVYMVQLSIPDEFDGVLLWDDGNAEPLYAGESFNQHQMSTLGEISDRTQYILQSIAMHRSEVEPVLSNLNIKDVREQFEKGLGDIKNTIKTFEKSVKSANAEVKDAVKNIKIPEPPKNIIIDLEKHLKMVETLYQDYTNVLNGIKRLEKSISSGKVETSKSIKDVVNTISSKLHDAEKKMVKTDDIKTEQKAITAKLDEHQQMIRQRLSTDFEKMMSKMENEGLNVLGSILKLLQSSYKSTPQGVEQDAFMRKMIMMKGGKR